MDTPHQTHNAHQLLPFSLAPGSGSCPRRIKIVLDWCDGALEERRKVPASCFDDGGRRLVVSCSKANDYWMPRRMKTQKHNFAGFDRHPLGVAKSRTDFNQLTDFIVSTYGKVDCFVISMTFAATRLLLDLSFRRQLICQRRHDLR